MLREMPELQLLIGRIHRVQLKAITLRLFFSTAELVGTNKVSE